jgi:hypothetical protein
MHPMPQWFWIKYLSTLFRRGKPHDEILRDGGASPASGSGDQDLRVVDGER